ncbi:MAG: response regulator [Planctomycetes bacterium]|nr:response regulator [Planctomycetota bacterium]
MRKILVVDDDRDILDTMRTLLEQSGFEIDVAMTPSEAIQKTRDGNPDLVILDVMLPDGYEGFEIARAIREDLHLRSLPVIILSCIHERKNVPYRFAPDEEYLPVDVFLDKSTEFERLLETINKLLGEHREEPDRPL